MYVCMCVCIYIYIYAHTHTHMTHTYDTYDTYVNTLVGRPARLIGMSRFGARPIY